ncbi:MAG: hypothetical protein JNL82_21910 [Myxococcales bacterium]|nr:hypothetical protein [Myxococcales bacterium]
MGIISEDYARTILAPYEETLLGIFDQAGAAFSRATLPAPPRRRTRANLISDAILSLASNAFPGQIAPRYYRELLLLQINSGEDLLINFKKLGRNGLPCNYPTQNAVTFANATLPCMPNEIRLTAGYVFDETHQRISEVRMLQQDGGRLLWSYEVLRKGQAVQMPLRVLNTATPAQNGKRVKAKTTARKAKEK